MKKKMSAIGLRWLLPAILLVTALVLGACESGIAYRPDLKMEAITPFIEMSGSSVDSLFTSSKEKLFYDSKRGVDTPPERGNIFFRTSLAGSPAYGVEKMNRGYQYVIYSDEGGHPWVPGAVDGKAKYLVGSEENDAPVLDFFAGQWFLSTVAAANYSPVIFAYGTRLTAFWSIMVSYYAYSSPDVVIRNFELESLLSEFGDFVYLWDGNNDGDVYIFAMKDGQIDKTVDGLLLETYDNELWRVKITP